MPKTPLRVLLVEDSDDDALLIEEELRERFEPTLERVYTRRGMLQALQSGPWDVIISDHNLPTFSATDALLMLLESGRDIPFIIVSGTIGEELAVEAMKAGAFDFVMKDALAKLGPAVQNAFDAGRSRQLHREAQSELQDSRERLRELASHLETARESERADLAREIHDELGGILTALKMDISWLQRRLAEADGPAHGKLAEMNQLTDGAIKTMRRIITELRPSILDDLGLAAALEWQATQFQRYAGIRVDLELGGNPDVTELDIPQAIAIAVFRILQESLTNVARHADASRVAVCFKADGPMLELTVRDDGSGIASEQTRKRGSFGILGMRERALNLGGAFTIGPAHDGGTEVFLRLPMSETERKETADADLDRR